MTVSLVNGVQYTHPYWISNSVHSTEVTIFDEFPESFHPVYLSTGDPYTYQYKDFPEKIHIIYKPWAQESFVMNESNNGKHLVLTLNSLYAPKTFKWYDQQDGMMKNINVPDKIVIEGENYNTRGPSGTKVGAILKYALMKAFRFTNIYPMFMTNNLVNVASAYEGICSPETSGQLCRNRIDIIFNNLKKQSDNYLDQSILKFPVPTSWTVTNPHGNGDSNDGKLQFTENDYEIIRKYVSTKVESPIQLTIEIPSSSGVDDWIKQWIQSIASDIEQTSRSPVQLFTMPQLRHKDIFKMERKRLGNEPVQSHSEQQISAEEAQHLQNVNTWLTVLTIILGAFAAIVIGLMLYIAYDK